MWGIFLVFGLIFGWVEQGFAVPKAGPMEGVQVESLRPIATPMAAASDLAAPDFAEHLEKIGDWHGAAVEWQRYAELARSDSDTAAAFGGYARAAEAYAKAELPELAHRLLDWAWGEAQALDEPAAHDALGVVILTLDIQPLRAEVAMWVADRLAQGHSVSAALDTALRDDLWAQAVRGRIEADFGLSDAATLRKAIDVLDRDLEDKQAMAAWLSVLPGFGHAYVGDSRTAGVVLMLWGVLGFGLFGALKRFKKQRAVLPDVLAWGLLMAGFWAMVVMSARDAVRLAALDARPAAFLALRAKLEAEAVVPVETEVPALVSGTVVSGTVVSGTGRLGMEVSGTVVSATEGVSGVVPAGDMK